MISLETPSSSAPLPHDVPSSPESVSPRKVHTYHCLCTQLLLATPYELGSLPCRQSPALDHAIILSLGAPPRSDQDDDYALERDGQDEMQRQISDGHVSMVEDSQERIEYSLLLSTTVDRKPIIVRREDGFEKRWTRRCGRCRLEIGYMLTIERNSAVGKGDNSGSGEGRVIYLLQGGLVETNEMNEKGWEARDADIISV